MKLKKIMLSLTVLIIFIITMAMQNATYAQVTTEPIYLGITELMMDNNPNMGYAIGKPGDENASKIWNIVRYSTQDSEDPTEANIYCVKAGVGFSDVTRRATYNIFYDMKTERDLIAKEADEAIKSLVEGKLELEDGTSISVYNAILAVLDMMYLPNESPAEEKTELLNNIIEFAKDPANGYTNYVGLIEKYPLTDNDISAVQQAALWYFTNYEEGQKYDKTDDKSWLNYTLNGKDYEPLANYTPNGLQPQYDEGQARTYQAEILYNYIIKQAKENANKYENIMTDEAPAKVNTTSLNYEVDGDNYIVGPINITENENSAIPYTIDFLVKNEGEKIDNYKLLNSDKTEVSEGTEVSDLVGQDFYISLPKDTCTNLSIEININYNNTKMTLWTSNKEAICQPVVIPEKEQISVPVKLTLNPKSFDLSLRKYITKINGEELTDANSRIPNIDVSSLATGTTATYKHKKAPVTVVTGDKVTYEITIYNEGAKSGRATKVIDQLPEGLKFTKVVSGNFELDSYDETTNTLNLKRKADNTDNLAPYTQGGETLASETIEIECEVTKVASTTQSTVLTNVAWIEEEYDAESNITITNQQGADRDSEPQSKPDVNKDNMENYKGEESNKEDLSDSDYYYKGEQDDDDFEKLVLLPESFDLKLIKRIVAVNNQNVPERIEDIDVSKLNTLDENGNLITTGEYTLNKEPVTVQKGDIVTYTFRIYNEGMINAYASEITEDIPEGLQFLWSEKQGEELANDETLTDAEKEAIEFNQNYLWGDFVYDETKENIIQISTNYLSKENETTVGGNLIHAFGRNDGSKTEEDLDYKEVSVKLKVISENISGNTIRNEAAITKDTDEEGNEVEDRDSSTEEWVKYEDDEDYDNIILQSFDLSLRKFIIAVSEDEQIEEGEYLKKEDGTYERAPQVDTSKLNTQDENGNMITTAIYNHTKEPVLVKQNDIVIYMLRVYNEGEIDGYASEITDYLPPYLEYVESEFNKEYGWEVSEDGREVTTRYLENEIIEKAKEDEEGKIVLTYKEVPIMCRVKENAKTSENITNIAEITEYQDENKEPVTDRDSSQDNVNLPEDENLPGYKDEETGEYIPGQEDDDDFEKVIVKIFDLSLRKWVTQAIVIDENGETITQTGHGPYDDPEEIVKVEIHRKKLDEVTVKFRYSIRVTNEGEIAGYAKEVTDYIPEGLKFLPEDNPGWTDEGNNIISTRLLENTLLQPGEYAEVEVVLTWINSEDNMGVMTNTAEISEDYNEYDVPDIDSTPDNQKPGEDDIDDAPVMLSIETGQVRIYFTLGFVILATIGGGIILIKKYIL